MSTVFSFFQELTATRYILSPLNIAVNTNTTFFLKCKENYSVQYGNIIILLKLQLLITKTKRMKSSFTSPFDHIQKIFQKHAFTLNKKPCNKKIIVKNNWDKQNEKANRRHPHSRWFIVSHAIASSTY